MNINIIEEKRKRKRISITEMCKAAEIDRTTYYKYMRNPDMMRISTWVKITDFLGMTLQEKKESLK